MIKVDYFSDVLCVWAFINEKRLEEVEQQLGKDLNIELHFLPNFASVHPKIDAGWKDRDGFEGYAEHVREVANQFDIALHKDTWSSIRPTSSMMAHGYIKAVQSIHGHAKAKEYALELRRAFFLEAKDVSKAIECKAVALSINVDWEAVVDYFESGQALADLNVDFQCANDYQISVSPAWVFNEGRQKLIGNVGYRVLEVNLNELISQKPLKHNWC